MVPRNLRYLLTFTLYNQGTKMIDQRFSLTRSRITKQTCQTSGLSTKQTSTMQKSYSSAIGRVLHQGKARNSDLEKYRVS